MASFPDAVEAILLAGGKFEDLPPGEEIPKGKGLVKVGGLPMAAGAVSVDTIFIIPPDIRALGGALRNRRR